MNSKNEELMDKIIGEDNTEKLLPDKIGPLISLEYNGLKDRLINIIIIDKDQKGGVKLPNLFSSRNKQNNSDNNDNYENNNGYLLTVGRTVPKSYELGPRHFGVLRTQHGYPSRRLMRGLEKFYFILKDPRYIHYVNKETYKMFDEASKSKEQMIDLISKPLFKNYLDNMININFHDLNSILNNPFHPLRKYIETHYTNDTFITKQEVLTESELVALNTNIENLYPEKSQNPAGGRGRTKSKSRKIKKILRKKSHKRKSSQKNGRTLKNKKRRKYSRNYKRTRKN